MNTLTYKKAGVDISEGDRFVSLISPMAKKTFRREVITDIGSFSALFKVDAKKYKKPVLVSGTDGVGTKLKIAFMTDRHDTVGIDLVAMCVNDILTSGAEPLFFLDYFATGRLKPEKAAEVVKGITVGCRQAGCSLIGGETAEMPGFYSEGEYDLAGFAVGVVDRDKIISGSKIKKGDAIIGLASNGLHSNGYSLVRKVFFGIKKTGVNQHVPELGSSLGEELLRPTRIYVKAFNALKDKVRIKGMAHITGGGITGNLPRIFPKGISAVIKKDSWPVPPIFHLIKKMGNVPDDEMRMTFNMGIGYIIVIPETETGKAISILKKAGYASFVIGTIEKGGRGTTYA
ncbi:MAG: phosphoribosylformylglycinamidine cyclo-ligase [Nitrospirae bacterium]|nr:MAG: phosphoribosylformylglycinamidine cyclo-ligase [Nitrospirota bacterium]